MKTKQSRLHLWIALITLTIFVLVGCQSSATETAAPTLDPNALSTSVAQTVEAELTAVAEGNPTHTPQPEATATPDNTATPTTEPTAAATATSTLPPTATATTPLSSASNIENHALFISDVTIPDGTEITVGQAFAKTWRLQNIGTATWTTEYSFVFINGSRMDGQAIKLAKDVAPGQTIDITINMIAPAEAGEYVGYWTLADEENTTFGIGAQANLPIYVDIVAVATSVTTTPTPSGSATATPTANPNATATKTPTVTPTATAASSNITDIELSVDNASYTGSCPVTLSFTANVELSGPQTFTYKFDAVATTSGFTFQLPPSSVVQSNQTGNHVFPLAFSLNIGNSVNANAKMLITDPVQTESNTLPFSVTCQ